MHIFARGEYQIVSFSPAMVRVCKFRKRGQKYRVVRCNTVKAAMGNEAGALRQALDENGGQIPGCLILTGSFESGTFFQCESASHSIREQRNALEFELPLHMLQVPNDFGLQFSKVKKTEVIPSAPVKEEEDDKNKDKKEEEAEVPETPDFVNVYAFDSSAIHSLASQMTLAKCKIDDFIYPLMGCRKEDPAIYIPEIEPGFCWKNGDWIPYSGNAAEINKAWEPIMQELIEPPKDNTGFSISDYLPCLLILRYLSDKSMAANEPSIRITPTRMRPSRCRIQVYIMAVLVLVLLLGAGYREAQKRIPAYQKFNALIQERDSLKTKNKKITDTLKKAEKEEKDLEKLVQLTAGDPSFLTKLYELSVNLPEASIVSSFRFTDSNTTLTVQAENGTGNVSTALSRLTNWKVQRIQDRRLSDTLTQYTVTLVPQTTKK